MNNKLYNNIENIVESQVTTEIGNSDEFGSVDYGKSATQLYQLTEDVACKFADWKYKLLYSFELRKVGNSDYQFDGQDKTLTHKELFDYFIKNIYGNE